MNPLTPANKAPTAGAAATHPLQAPLLRTSLPANDGGALFRVTVAHRGAAPTEITRRFVDAAAAHEFGMDLRRLPEDRVEVAAIKAPSVEFIVAGVRYPLAAMLRANEDDEDFIGWLLTAKPGDVYEAMHAESVECVELDGQGQAFYAEADRAQEAAKDEDCRTFGAREASRAHLAELDRASVIGGR